MSDEAVRDRGRVLVAKLFGCLLTVPLNGTVPVSSDDPRNLKSDLGSVLSGTMVVRLFLMLGLPGSSLFLGAATSGSSIDFEAVGFGIFIGVLHEVSGILSEAFIRPAEELLLWC